MSRRSQDADSEPLSGHVDNRRSVGGLQRRMPDEIANAIDKIEPALWIGRRYARFRRLTSHPLFDRMYAQMLAGVSPSRIAAWLQQQVDPGDVLGTANVSPESLERSLYRFKERLPEGVFLARSVLDDRFRRLNLGIDVLEEFDTLIRLQKSRIERFIELEKALPLSQIRLEIETLAVLLTQRDNAAKGTVGLPVIVNYGGQHLTVNSSDSSPLANIRQFLWSHPNQTAAVLDVLDRLDAIEAAATGDGGTSFDQGNVDERDGQQPRDRLN